MGRPAMRRDVLGRQSGIRISAERRLAPSTHPLCKNGALAMADQPNPNIPIYPVPFRHPLSHLAGVPEWTDKDRGHWIVDRGGRGRSGRIPDLDDAAAPKVRLYGRMRGSLRGSTDQVADIIPLASVQCQIVEGEDYYGEGDVVEAPFKIAGEEFTFALKLHQMTSRPKGSDCWA